MEYPSSETDTFFQGNIASAAQNAPADQKNQLVAHEVGHALALDHSGSCPTDVMTSQICSPGVTQLSSLDLSRYAGVYDASFPTSITGNSPSVGQVSLSWNASDIHSEEQFAVYRWDWGSSSWTLLSTVSVPRNSTSILFGGQPGGTQRYTLGSVTGAGCIATGGVCPYNPTYYELTVIAGADLVVTSTAPVTTSVNEGTSKTWNITVTNQGNSNAGAFAVRMEFGGSARPYPEGVCSFNLGMLAGQSLTCTTSAVTTGSFGGGSMLVRADYASQVTETNETNNTQTGGTFQVVPAAPSEANNDVVTWPAGGSLICGSVGGSPCFAWKDRSNIEKSSGGYTVRLQRVASSSCSGSWSTVSTTDYSGVSGTGTTITKSFSPVRGYCYRIQVRANSPTASSSYVIDSQPQWYP